MPAELLTTAEAAQRLEVAESTVRLLLKDGRLKGVRLGRDWAIPEENLAGVVVHDRGRRRKETP